MIRICIIGRKTVSYEGDLHFRDVERLGEVFFSDATDEDGVVAACQRADALLVNKTEITEGVLSRLPRLKYVGIFATGYNNVDLAACKKYGVTCTNVPDYSTNAVAQHTLALLLSAAGSLPSYFASVARGDWLRSPSFSYHAYPTQEVAGKTLGIFGLGNIGSRVAAIAEALQMKVIYYNRTPKKTAWEEVGKEELFSRADFLSLHCALTQETENLVNRKTLSLMKPSAYLINTARGGLVDEHALKAALEGDALAGAYLDVVKKEPMTPACPLLGAKNCFITPHTAWSPVDTRQELIRLAAENLRAFLDGRPINVIA